MSDFDQDLDLDFDSAVDEFNNPKSAEGIKIFGKNDERIWKPDYKKSAIYQFYFLPFVGDDGKLKLTATYSTHDVKFFADGKNKKLFGVCPKSTGLPCKICDHGWDGWKEASKIEKDAKKNFLPSQNDWVNIYMVKDPLKPENNGKVFLYKLTKSVSDLIKERTDAKLAEKKKDNPFFVQFNPFNPQRTSKFMLDVNIPESATANDRCDYKKSMFLARGANELEAIPVLEGKTKAELKDYLVTECYNIQESVTEYVEAKLITDEMLKKYPVVIKMLAGQASGMESIDSIPGHNSSVDTGDSSDAVTDSEKEFLDSLG
jgi:hypothetical protein